MRKSEFGWGRCGLAVAGVVIGATLAFGQAGDAAKVMGEARKALGGDKKLDAVKSITATGRTFRTGPNGTTTEGDFELAMELPDKFVRRDILAALGSMSVYRLSGFNGTGVINEIDQPPQLAGGNVMVRTVVVGPGGPTDGNTTPEQKELARQAMLQASRRDFTRLALGMFAKAPDVFPLTFTSAGTAESPDGTADVIDVKGENFTARLFIDSKTHLPLMLSWMDKEPMRVIRQMGGPGGQGGAPAPAGGAAGGSFVVSGGNVSVTPAGAGQGGRVATPTPEEREKLDKQMAEQVKEAEAKRKTVEFRVFYSDYRPVDGVMLPHRIQSSADGKPTEEIALDAVKVNPKIDAKRFAVSK